MQSALPSLNDASARDAAARVPRTFAFRYDVLPLRLRADVLELGAVDPDDRALLDAVHRTTRLRAELRAMSRDAIRDGLRRLYDVPAERSEYDAREAPAVRAADRLLAAALDAHASDLHLEARPHGGVVRLRVDGIVRETETIGAELFPALTSRVKLLAAMDIADRRQPQDGRFTYRSSGRDIDVRVSSIPALDGEKLVLRLLDLHAVTPQLDALGMSAALAQRFRDVVRAPWGFVVVSGPTGSGKTTTVYASLGVVDVAAANVCSVEDPVERRMAGVTQVGVNVRAGVTFASALRSFMRQDPNLIVVGEMRDAETAGVAVSAALAGQLVLTTLHSNDAPRTVERLVELGVARSSLAAGLTAVVAQRLVRTLCSDCRREPDARNGEIATWRAVGCSACAGTGYRGRTGCYELLAIDDDVRDAIAAGASSVTLARLARARGYRPMVVDALDKVRAGVTTLAEVWRVVGAQAGQ